MKIAGLTCITFLLIIIAAQPALADKQVIETIRVEDAPQGAGKTGTIETWIGNQRYARIDRLNNVTTIVRIDLQKMWLVLHDSNDVMEVDLPFVLPDYLQPLFDEVAMEWELNRLPEKRTIGQWQCSRIIITGRGTVNVDIEMWVSDDTSIDTTAFNAMIGEALQSSAIYREMGEKLSGIAPNFSIRTTTTIQQLGVGTRTVAEVQSISELQPPAGTYEVPEEYTVRPLDFSTYLSMVRIGKPGPDGR